MEQAIDRTCFDFLPTMTNRGLCVTRNSADLEGLFKLTGLGLEVLPSALFLPSSLITLIQVTTQVLYLLLLLPEYLA